MTFSKLNVKNRVGMISGGIEDFKFLKVEKEKLGRVKEYFC